MFKLLLVDDEAVILHGLRQLLPWKNLEIEIIGEAKDGKEALRIIEEKKPDIVLSDIAMPNLSGIELLKIIAEQKKNTKIIFLSGYQEFHYAREAVKYGASDYLLKPVKREELQNSITNALQQLKEEKMAGKRRRLPKKEEILFQEVITKKDFQKEANEILRMEENKKNKMEVTIAALKIFVKNKIATEKNKNYIREEVYDYIEKVLKEYQIGMILREEYHVCYFMLYTEKSREQILRYCQKVVLQISRKYPVDIILGVGDWMDIHGKLMYLYDTAKFALEFYYFNGERMIYYSDIIKEGKGSILDYQQVLEDIKRQIVMNFDEEQIIEDIRKSLKLLEVIHYGHKNALVNSCIQLAGEIFRALENCGMIDREDRMEEWEEFLEEIRKKSTFHLLQQTFDEYYRGLFLQMKLCRPEKKVSEIQKIKQYIQEHYKENITLEELAGFIGMNPAYMSVFFKKETGKNFKTYLTEVRMEQALRLMNQTNLKNYELAEAVGYRDVKQFREKFREIYGISPQEYKKRGKF